MITQVHNDLYSHVIQLEQCSSIGQVKAICQKYLQTIGIQYFKYSWKPPAITQSEQVAFWTCGDECVEQYQLQNYGDIDPKMRYADSHYLPTVWDANIIKNKLSKKQTSEIDFWTDSLDMGVASGITIPIRGNAGSKGSLCVAFDTDSADNRATLLSIYETWAMHLHNRVESLYALDQLKSPLSEREQEVLKWTVSGKTCEEVAKILYISQNTVLFHLSNLRLKLGVNNKHHLIARALSLGLVDL